MSVRWFLAAVGAAAIAGCGDAPSPRFVLNEPTKKLDRGARVAVEGELVKNFGEPHALVAWQKLPVDFGALDGVVESSAQQLTDPFDVRLTQKSGSVVPADLSDIKDIRGAAIVWNTGPNSVEQAWLVNGKEQTITFQVESFAPSKRGESGATTLRLRVVPPGAAGGLKAPQKGEKFTLIGGALQHGRRLYMTHCLHCHGVSGDGDGPTAPYLSPRPRDYRRGTFKFTSTRSNTDKARREDLTRTIHQGIPGTYMPSFLLFTDEETSALVEYVRFLAMRGEFEMKLANEFNDYTIEAVNQRVKGGESNDDINKALAAKVKDELAQTSDGIAGDLRDIWNKAEDPATLIVPEQHRTPDSPESRERGRKLFLSDVAKCAQCHGPAGRGDGPQTEDFMTIPGSNKKYTVPGLFDDWGHPIKPRDLTTGIYRGGRRPIDIYRRIYSGIKGTPMPPGGALRGDQIWDLVNYVMSIPFQKGSESPEERPQQPKIASTAEAAPAGAGGN